jgi:alkylhydroperoxidase/carboxymuconolactone decarboxylase family protein YurZ
MGDPAGTASEPPGPEGIESIDRFVEYAGRRARDIPPVVRHLIAGLYRLVTGPGAAHADPASPERAVDDLAMALSDGLDPDALAAAVEVLVVGLGLPVWTRGAWRIAAPGAPGGPIHRAGRGVDIARKHYEADGDLLPEPIEVLAERMPELAELFVTVRGEAVSPGSALDPPTRELLLAVLSGQAGYLAGALRHLDRARSAGLPLAALREALACVTLTHGVSAWHAFGRDLWRAAVDAERS